MMHPAAERALFFINRHLGRSIPAGLRHRLLRIFYPAGAPQPKMLVVDIVSSCNLRCPSCPVGNSENQLPQGLMDKALFRQIVDKAYDRHGMRVAALYNWTEPFLHPELPEFVRIVKERGMVCAISSNLNILRNIDAVLQAGLDVLRISLSGFSQNHYGKTHARGDIEKVKAHMREVSEAVRRNRSNTAVTVYYHKYRHNLEDLEPMKAYAKSLGFGWMESWAYYMPLEKVMQFDRGTLKEEDRKFVETYLALPLEHAIEEAAKLPGFNRCSLLEDQIVLDHRGQVGLCCTVYDGAKNGLGDFMQMDAEELAAAKSGHPTCTACASRGMHKYFSYHTIPPLAARYDALAREALKRDADA